MHLPRQRTDALFAPRASEQLRADRRLSNQEMGACGCGGAAKEARQLASPSVSVACADGLHCKRDAVRSSGRRGGRGQAQEICR